MGDIVGEKTSVRSEMEDIGTTEELNMNHADRSTWITCANVLACLAVIMLHCNGVFWSHPSGMLWITSNFIETAFFWAVPVFFMIIGAVQIDYHKKYRRSL